MPQRDLFECLEPRQLLAVFTVTNTSDSGAGSLRQAVTDANIAAGADVITFDGGVTGTITLGGTAITISDDLSISGPGAATLSVNANNASGVVVIAANKTVSISGLTITGGHATGQGGGVLNRGTLTLTSSIVTGNSSTDHGPGIANTPGGTLVVTNSTISSNTTSATQRGGGIFNDAGGFVTVTGSMISGNAAGSSAGLWNGSGSTMNVTSSTISGNTAAASNASGGIGNGGTMTLANSTVSGNSASSGAGISNSGTMTIVDSTISANTATGVGGGIWNLGSLTAIHSTISGNSANTGGGGIYNFAAATLALNGSTISGNTYGGITNAGTLAVTNSTLSGNTTSNAGGGIFNDSAGIATLTNSTVTGNSSVQGGDGIFARGTLTVRNCTISGNSGSGGGGIRIDSGTVTLVSTIVSANAAGDILSGTLAAGSTNNLIKDGAHAGGLTNGVNGNIIGVNPLLGVLANYGGPTQTMSLPGNSPAIGHGLNPGSLTTDQRGGPFSRGAAVDIGAYQRQSLALVVDNVVDENDWNYSAGDISLREAIAAAGPNPGSDTVSFAPALNGQTITLAGTELSVLGDLTITGPGAGLLTVSGNNASRVFNIDANSTVAISGLTISGGNSTAHGGGINNAGTLSLSNSTISANHAANGGGIDVSGAVTVTNTTISANTATVSGGGLFVGLGSLTLTNSTISGNSAHDGGGIANGGALTVTNSTISGNTATAYGGGIQDASAEMTVTGSTISGNTAVNGAGISSGGLFETLTNSTISGNTATGIGGGVHSYYSGVHLTVRNCTIAANLGGGGVRIDGGVVTIVSTIVSGNAGGDVPASTLAAGSINNLIQNAGSAGGLTNGVNGNLVGVDPLLGPLAANGGPTRTHALLAGSPAINMGINPGILTTDQRGGLFARGTSVDIGAYQRQTFNLVVDTLSDVVDGNYSAGNLSLREAISVAANPGNDTITFATSLNGGTITLGGTELAVTGDVTISGPGANLLSVNGNHASRVITFVSGTSTLSGLTVTGGKAASGGGISNGGNLTITSAAILGNVGSNFGGGSGGGILNTGTLTITNSTISGNSADAFGGGIYNPTGTVTISNSTISGNGLSSAYGGVSVYGGGIYNDAGTLSVTNSTISGNLAYLNGGGIYNATGTTTIKSTIVAGNRGATYLGGGGLPDDVGGTFAAGSTNNLIQDAAHAGGLANGVNGNLVGVDPKLSALANNGGPTKTMALAADSPAIGKGLNPNNLTTDQRGGLFARGTSVDIGAYQRQAFNLVVDTLVDEDDGNYGAGDFSLREAINLANINPVADTITFAAAVNNGTITLGGTELAVTGDVTISGPGANLLSVNGNNASRAFNFQSGTSTLSGLTITGGRAALLNGGGIYNVGTLTIINSTVSASFGEFGGGGIYSTGTLTVVNSTLSGNSTVYLGGGISSNGTLTVTNSTIAGNTARVSGGGISSNGTLTVTNSTIAGNVATGDFGSGLGGGGISNSGTLTVTNSTIAGNTANPGRGGGIENSGTLIARSTIVAGNTGGDVSGTFAAGSTNNLIQDAAHAGGLTNGVNGNLVGVDPLLGPLAANGGPTRTYALLAGSPAIGNGINPNNLTTDQRGTGFARVRGNAIDIGAFEFSADPTIASLSPSASSAPRGQSVTLTANTVADPDGTIARVDFYLDANGNGVADTGELIGSDADSAGGYTLTYSVLFSLGLGSTTFMAIAVDNDGGLSGTQSAAVLVVQPLPQTYTVTVAADEDDGDRGANDLSLREAILLSNTSIGVADTITFAPALNGRSIALSGSGLSITDGVTITGPGPTLLTVIGIQGVATFTFAAGTTSTLSGLTISGGGTGVVNEGVLTLHNSTVSGNQGFAFSSGGRGISNSGTMTVSNSTISGNIAYENGAGILNSGTMTVMNSAVFENQANGVNYRGITSPNSGGGVYNSGTMTVTNSTVSGNSANFGGGIGNSGTLTLTNSTVAFNAFTAYNDNQGQGGGIYTTGGTVTITSTIVAGNTGGDFVGGTLGAGSTNNLIQDASTAGGLVNGVNSNLVGVDPLLGPLFNNGGTTRTIALMTGSPAFNNGINPGNLTTDQRGTGFARTRGSAIDIGAYEGSVDDAASSRGVPTGSADSSNTHRAVSVNPFGHVIVFEQGWTVTDLQTRTGAPIAISDAVIWVDPKDNLTYVAAPSNSGLILFVRSAAGAWTYRNLTTESGATSSPTNRLVQLISKDRIVVVAGFDANGHIVAFRQTLATASGGGPAFSFVDISGQLTQQSMATPDYSSLTTFVTNWNTWHLVGIDAGGQIQSVWIDVASFSQWRVDNLSAQYGAPPVQGQLAVTLTTWGGINLTGLDTSGHLRVTWWVPGSVWDNADLTVSAGGASFTGGSITGYGTPWGGMNYIGLDSNGQVVGYWWAPDHDQWFSGGFLPQNVPASSLPARSLSSYSSSAGTLNVFGATSDNDAVRMWWQPGAAAWTVENLTEVAVRA